MKCFNGGIAIFVGCRGWTLATGFVIVSVEGRDEFGVYLVGYLV